MQIAIALVLAKSSFHQSSGRSCQLQGDPTDYVINSGRPTLGRTKRWGTYRTQSLHAQRSSWPNGASKHVDMATAGTDPIIEKKWSL